MSATPFDIDQVIARIKEQASGLQTVEGVASYAAITGLRDFRPPCAYALLVREVGDNAEPKNGQQRALVTFGVVIAARNYRDKRGAETLDAIDPLLDQVRKALIGWTPALPGGRPTKWLQGDVLDYDNNTLLWSDVFQTQHFIGG